MTNSADAAEARQVLFSGQRVRLMSAGGWEYAERIGIEAVVAVVALFEERLILTEQFRKPVAARVIDLPAGLVGDEAGSDDEDIAAAARRELLEETGFEADDVTFLAEGPPSAGLTTEIVTLLHATGLRRVQTGGGVDSEEIEVHEVPLTGIDDWLSQRRQAGTLIDPRVYAALYFVGRIIPRPH